MKFIKKYYYNEILHIWLDDRKKTVKYSSYQKYYNIITNFISPALGNCNIKKITQKKITDFFESEIMVTKSDSTKKTILTIIKSSLKYALENNYIKKLERINIRIKKPKSRITYFTITEQQNLISYLMENNNIKNLGILIALFTGIRIGELCGLKRKDFDFDNETMYINRTVQRIKNRDLNASRKTVLYVDAPKTDHSIRTIPLPKFLNEIIAQYLSSILDEEYYIFTNSLKPMEPRYYEQYFREITTKCKIRALNFHALRHTFATRSREAGIDIKVLSEILGHSSYHITQEIYVHVSNDLKKQSINSLSKYIESL